MKSIIPLGKANIVQYFSVKNENGESLVIITYGMGLWA
jgi:hypothetical protein